MEPEIYKPSIHKGAGIYNTGAEGGGGGGGGNAFFRKGKYSFFGNFGEDCENKILTPMLPTNYAGGGGFFINDNLDGFEKLSLKLTFNKHSAGGSNTIIGYQAANSSFDTGRLFSCFNDFQNGKIIFKVASNPTSWSEYQYTGYSFGINKIEVDVEKINTNYKIICKINDIEKYNSTTPIYNEGYFKPTFFLENFSNGTIPNYKDLYVGEYIDMNNSSLIIDDEVYFCL
jgi:hypothetical protein